MVDRLCDYLIKKIRNKMPEIDDERADVIDYGLHLVIGELPKNLILLIIAYLLGVFQHTLIAVVTLLPYRGSSGGFHLKTHLGCITATSIFYIGNSCISKVITWNAVHIKYSVVIAIWVFSILMIRIYAPADTEYVPILNKKNRRIKKILSYITMTLTLAAGIIIKDNTISNICMFGVLMQTLSITKFTYKLAKCRYGHEVYNSGGEAT